MQYITEATRFVYVTPWTQQLSDEHIVVMITHMLVVEV
jgi:hypothetical protein